jgi:Delta14-sterol reductase
VDFMLPLNASTLATGALMVLGFMGALFVGSIVLPGLERNGYPQPDGSRKRYRLSGMTLFFFAHVVVVVATFAWGVSLAPVVRHFWALFVAANAVAFAITAALFISARRRPHRLHVPHPEGNRLPETVKDLWFGAELNPTWVGVDIKMYMYHPSLIGAYLIVAGFAYLQYERHGLITPQMWCFVGFWFGYLFTHYVKEEFMLSTWDVISENFGFMLVWGDLVYVPFLYSLPGWWLVDQVEPWTVAQWGPLVAFYLFCLWVFRESNWQKERYKQDHAVHIWGKPAETVGGRLLVSGWWGLGRKINYTGEIGVYLAFALTTGFQSWGPYLLPLSLTLLLVQRAARDDKKCRTKYGELWTEYCRRVRFRMLPFVY